MAKKLKQTFKVPWVMHMSDPWALSPLRSNTSNQAREDEYELLSSADMVTFTTGKTCELYKQAYPEYATRMRVLPNVFDPDDIVNQTKSQGKHPKFRIVYTGGLTQQRPLHFIEKVLETLKQKDEVIFGKFEILFAGPMDRYGRKFFKHYKQKNVMHLGELSYVDVQELQRTADVLLVLDSPTTSKDAIFFPSKLLDYFLTSRPILAITPEGSSTRDILTNYPSQCFVHDDYQGIANFIFDRIETRLVHQPIQFDPPNKYSAKTNAALLIELLCSLDREKEYKHQS